MSNDTEETITIVGCFILFICIVITAIGYVARCANLKEEAIQRGHAHYHPVTGEWTWKETEGESK